MPTRRARQGLSNAFLLITLMLTACGGDDERSGGDGAGATGGSAGAAGSGAMAGTGGGAAGVAGAAGGVATPVGAYSFDSRFEPGTSSVRYAGQIWRHVVIDDLQRFVGNLTADIDAGNPLGLADEASVIAALDFYFRFKVSGDGSVPHRITTTPEPLQVTYDDINLDSDLVSKLAGNDAVTDHRDWSTAFSGWSDTTLNDGAMVTSPEVLVDVLFRTIARNAVLHLNGTPRFIPGSAQTAADRLPVHVTETGLDLQQLLQKHLLGALAYSQGADDYLDDDVADKGLLSSNARDGMNAYSTLEHAWDEGFGYFGAPRNYDEYTDEEIAKAGGRDDWQGHHDANGDGFIDLHGEFVFGASANAAKRDLGSATSARTDYTKQAFDAFLAGRELIAGAGDALTTEELTRLRAHRDVAVDAWERALAATMVHYVNEVLGHMSRFDTTDYSFRDHAKHWSELKGFALGLQFNPRSQVTPTDFAALHAALGDRPVLPPSAGSTAQEIADYRAALLTARDVLRSSYGFDAANVGDANGENGW